MAATGKTTAQHKRDGTYQKCRHGQGELPVAIPEMPAFLGTTEEAAWKRLVKDLEAAGLVAEVDGEALRLLCEVIAVRLDALDSVKLNGIATQGKRGMVTNPAVKVFFAAWDRESAMLKQFGCTPVGRRGLNLDAEKDAGSELDELFRVN